MDTSILPKKKIFNFLFFISLAASQLAAQDLQTVPSFIRDSLDSYVLRSMKDWRLPGLALCIIKDGRVEVMKGYGSKSIDKNDPVDANTLFMIGSNTKAFTGTAMALLEYEKKCTLEDKVQKWLPEFRMKDKCVGREVTLTDLLCHRMGLETYQGDFMYWTSALSLEEVTRKFRLLTPVYGFRSRYGYTNAGFAIAGACLGRISGMKWQDFVATQLFSPLQMNRTQSYSDNFARQENIARAYTLDGDSIVETPMGMLDNLAAAGSISSSVNDMSHWLLCQLDSGRFLGKQVIPFAVLQRTRQPQTFTGLTKNPFNNPTHFSLYGLGWRMTDYDGKLVIGHAGAVNGYHSSVTFLPEEQLGIIILTNSDFNSLYDALKWEIIDAYLGLPYRNYSARYLEVEKKGEAIDNAQMASWRDSVRKQYPPSLPLKMYCGKYRHEAYGQISIKLTGNRLEVSFEHHPRLTARLECMGGNRFLCTYSDPEFGVKAVEFTTRRRHVKALMLHVADGIDMMGYVFRKG